ncbi:MAG: tRNA uridine(34) 5-carboxymethylaminomethyl modification radical SAM/GNAT enzyme Elp3 [Patescibacteria group bacterium]|jgi:elongator complex protein 3
MNTKLVTITKGLIKAKIKTRPALVRTKKQLANSLRINAPLNSDLLAIYHNLLLKRKIKPDQTLTRLLRKREIRTLSGVAVLTVLTKPYPCPGQCIYCPNETGMPKSYLSNEPAAMRAFLTKFNPYTQVKVRLEALKINGHETDKIELIVLGGSWSAYPKKYQTWFIKRCFEALNGKTSKTLDAAQKQNEKAKHRCVGLTLETRPDMITFSEIKRMRELGCTRVELGVQSIYDQILKLNKRGHTVKQTILATKLLKRAGFKVMYHLMPNLPGSSPAKDLKMFQKIFSSSDFQPDLLKIYPCVVTKNTPLYRWFKQHKYQPYSDKQLKNLLLKIKRTVPYYVRITRLVRDIPAESIVAGNKITNLRQLITKDFKDCKCIRCREAGHQRSEIRNKKSVLRIQNYKASEGTEYFLSYESPDQKVLYAFLRLRLPACHPELVSGSRLVSESHLYKYFPELQDAALIRELHTYGEMAPIGKAGKVQHLGLGKKLMIQAEAIAKKQKIKKIAIISGIGVRKYYEKLGYRLEGTYMVKHLG